MPEDDDEDAIVAALLADAALRQRVLDRLGVQGDLRKVLADYMSDLSEAYWCAGWLEGWEYTLWGWLQRDDLGTSEERARLRTLYEACGGWVVFREEASMPDPATEPNAIDSDRTFVPAAEWETLFAKWKNTKPPLES